ncbi:MAG TPA: hypothetical protein VE912_24090 [Bacteroidales bacterium]|nr:hypothetical protein [Bacteroidales bacterium]
MYNENDDPVAYCIRSLQSGKNKEVALEKAEIALSDWWAISAVDRNLTEDEIENTLFMRAIVLATVATVYVWNGEFKQAFALENQFIYQEDLWEEDNRQVIEGYLSHLVYQKQFEHLDIIYREKAFRKEFIQIENIYKSVQNKDYEIKGNRLEFVSSVNRLNKSCKLL